MAADTDHNLLDREKQEILYLTVEAIDGGGLRTSAQLEIRLLDVNDNSPRIARNEYEGYAKENSVVLDRSIIVEVSVTI